MLLAAIGALCISSSGVLVELAASGAATTAFFRCALALPFLVPLALREHRRLGPRTPRARATAVLAGLFFAVDLVLWTHAINEVGAGIATVLGNLQVVFVAAAAWLLFSERPSARFALALPVVFAGVVLVSGLAGRPSFGGNPAAGIVFGVGTSLAHAAFLMILRGAAGTPHVAAPLLDATASAAVGSLILGGIFGTLDLAPPLRSLGWLLLLAVSSQTIGWMFITSSLPRLPRAISSLMLLLQPVAALGLAALVLSERPTLLQLLGAALICGGVLLVARHATPAHEATTLPLPTRAGPTEPVASLAVLAHPGGRARPLCKETDRAPADRGARGGDLRCDLRRSRFAQLDEDRTDNVGGHLGGGGPALGRPPAAAAPARAGLPTRGRDAPPALAGTGRRPRIRAARQHPSPRAGGRHCRHAAWQPRQPVASMRPTRRCAAATSGD